LAAPFIPGVFPQFGSSSKGGSVFDANYPPKWVIIARQLTAYERGICEVPDVHNLAVIEATERNNIEVAIQLEKQVLGCQPTSPEVYMFLADLLIHRGLDGDLEEAFQVAKMGVRRCPQDRRALVNLLRVGFSAGHDRDVGPVLKELVQFPDVLQPYSVEQLGEMIKSQQTDVAKAEQLYRTGPLPVLVFCALGPIRTPYYRFWRGSTMRRSGLEVSLGTQPGLATQLVTESMLPTAVVLDYTAMVTLHELFGGELPGILPRAFTRIYVPESLRGVLYAEGRLLAEMGQPARIAAQHKVSEWVDQSDKVEFIPPVGDTADLLGSHAARKHATEQGIPLLDEYMSEEDVSEGLIRVGLSDVARALGLTAAPPSVQEQIASLARPQDDDAKAVLQEGTAIAVDVQTLVTLAEVGGLLHLSGLFSKIFIAKRGMQWLRGELSQSGFEEDCRHRFRLLERTIADLERSGVLVFQGVRRQGDDAGESDQDENSGGIVRDVLNYVRDLLALATSLTCPLVADDRALQVITEEGLSEYRFGTDVLLRWLLLAGVLDARTYREKYDLFREWNYRFLPPDPDYLSWLATLEPRGEAGAFKDALDWYSQVVHQMPSSARLHPAYRDQLQRASFSSYVDSLWLVLVALWLAGAEPDTAAPVLRRLAPDRVLPELAGRGPEFLQLLLIRASIGPRSRSTGGEEVSPVDPDWLDAVLQAVPYDADDIDLAWVDLVRGWMDEAQSKAPDEGMATALVADVLVSLPVRARARLAQSDAGTKLQESLGVRIETHYTFALRAADGETAVRIPESVLDEACARAAHRLLAEGAQLHEEAGLVFRLSESHRHGFLRVIEVLPTQADPRSCHGRPLERVVNLLPWLDSADPAERQKAWQTGVECLKVVEDDADATGTAQTYSEHLAIGLLSADEQRWRPVALRCEAILRHSLGVVLQLVEDAVLLGLSGALPSIIGWTEPADAASWLGITMEVLHDESVFAQHADAAAGELATVAGLSDGSISQLVAKLEKRWQSVFPDAVATFQPLTHALSVAQQGEREAVLDALLSMAEDSCSRSVKANAVCVAVLAHEDLVGQGPVGDSAITSLSGRIRSLLMACIVPPRAAHRGDSSGAATCVLSAETLVRALYAAWLESGIETPALRYLAWCAGHLLAHELGKRKVAVGGTELSQELEQYATDRLNIHLEQAPPEIGFCRPELIRYLRYHAAFLGQQLADHRDVVGALMDDESRGLTLQSAALHAIAYACLGGLSALGGVWLDASLALDPSGGMAALLDDGDVVRATWPADQQNVWHVVQQPDPNEHWAWLVPGFVAAEADSDAVRYLDAFGLGTVAPTEDWLRRVAVLLTPGVVQRATCSIVVWNRLLALVSSALIRYREPCDAVGVLEAFLFAPSTTMQTKQELLPVQAGWLAGLCSRELYLDMTAAWLEATATEKQLTLTTRRRCIRRFTEVWSLLPEAARAALEPALTRTAGNLGLPVLIELKPFVH
jgi:hypothetical protein